MQLIRVNNFSSSPLQCTDSNRTAYANEGFSYIQRIPNGYPQAGYPFSVAGEGPFDMPRLYSGTGNWKKASPSLKVPKGYELINIGVPSFGPNGLMNLNNNWKGSNEWRLQVKKFYIKNKILN